MQQEKIVSETWTPNPVKGGFLSYQGQRTISDVRADVVAVLDRLHFSDSDWSAYRLAEWMTTNSKFSDTDDFPRGEMLVVKRRGSCEGTLIQVVCQDLETSMMTPVFTLKYLLPEEQHWQIVRKLYDALSLGI